MVEATSVTVNLGAARESTIAAAVPPTAIAAWLRERSRAAPPWRHLSMRLVAPRCLFCGQSADLGSVDLCLDCLEALPWWNGPRADGGRAAQSPEPLSGEHRGAVQPALEGSPITDEFESIDSKSELIDPQTTLIALRYAPPADGALRALKFHGDLAPARVLGAVLAAVAALRGPLPDLLIPVPLHPDRLHERGFNQAAELAGATALWLERPCAPGLLERRRPTEPQTSLEAAARRRNVVGAFARASGSGRWLRRRAPLARHVALVDDVLTTGATMQAAAAALHGFETVSCWAIARPVSTSFTPDAPLA